MLRIVVLGPLRAAGYRNGIADVQFVDRRGPISRVSTYPDFGRCQCRWQALVFGKRLAGPAPATVRDAASIRTPARYVIARLPA